MNEQQEYHDFVFQYFNNIGIILPPNMNTWFTTDAEVENRYFAVFAKEKEDGQHEPSGFLVGPNVYFMGSNRIGFLIPTIALYYHMQPGAFRHRKTEDGYVYINPDKQWCIRHSLMITYFRVIKEQEYHAHAPRLRSGPIDSMLDIKEGK